MSRVCSITGKRGLVGNRVSHAKNRTKMKQEVNLKTKKIFIPETGETIRMRISARAVKTLDKVGGLVKFLRKEFRK